MTIHEMRHRMGAIEFEIEIIEKLLEECRISEEDAAKKLMALWDEHGMLEVTLRYLGYV